MWKQWKCLSLDESVKRGGDGGGGVCVNIIQPEGRGYPAICNHMDGPRKHYSD